jgi:hypothetical protein
MIARPANWGMGCDFPCAGAFAGRIFQIQEGGMTSSLLRIGRGPCSAHCKETIIPGGTDGSHP